MRTGAATLGQRARHELIPQRLGDLLGLAGSVPFGIVRPRLLEDEHVGIEGGAGCDGVEGPAPPVDSRVHVEVDDTEHGAA